MNGVLSFEALATKYIKKWYGVNASFNPQILYLGKNICGWELTSPVALLKSMQVVAQHILKFSSDPLTSSLSILSRKKSSSSKSRRWDPGSTLDRLESDLDFSIRYGGQCGSQGLGYGCKTNLRHASTKERRKAISNLCKKEDADARLLSLQDLARSGDFLKWDNLMNTQADWNTQVLRLSGKELSFALNSQSFTLPSPSNLRRWGFNTVAKCMLCGKFAASASHILAGCIVGLEQGRYTFRHDNVLRCMLSDLRGLVSTFNRRKLAKSNIPVISKSFIAAGTKKTRLMSSPPTNRSLLGLANDWVLQIDLDGSFTWPVVNCPQVVKPDIMLVSNLQKIVIWGELTSPMERRMTESAVKKKERYLQLKVELSLKNWTVHDFTFEVGARGFCSSTLGFFLSKLGFPSHQRRFMTQRMCTIALRSSFYIWNARCSLAWNPPILCSASACPVSHRDRAIAFLGKLDSSCPPAVDSKISSPPISVSGCWY